MKLINLDFNISNSIRNINNAISPLLSRVQELITQVWERIKGKQEASISENFVSYIEDHNFNVTDNQEVTDYTLETKPLEVDFDIIRREFDSLSLRKAIDNNESVFFEDDFVSSSDWADAAVQGQESLTSRIIPLIEDANIIQNFFTLRIEEELGNLNPKLNLAEEKAARRALLEQESHKDLVINLQKEKEEDLYNRLDTLEQKFKEKERDIARFKSLGEKSTDQYLKNISHASSQFGVHDKKISKQAQKLSDKRKKFVSSVVRESLERINKQFKIESLEINEEINSKFSIKEKTAEKNLEEKLASIQENLLKEKQMITDLSNQEIKSLRSEIQSSREKLVKNLQSPQTTTSPKEELFISSETW